MAVSLRGNSIELLRREFGQGWYETVYLGEGGLFHYNNTNQLTSPTTLLSQTPVLNVYSPDLAEITFEGAPQTLEIGRETLKEIIEALKSKRLDGLEIHDFSPHQIISAFALSGAMTAV